MYNTLGKYWKMAEKVMGNTGNGTMLACDHPEMVYNGVFLRFTQFISKTEKFDQLRVQLQMARIRLQVSRVHLQFSRVYIQVSRVRVQVSADQLQISRVQL